MASQIDIVHVKNNLIMMGTCSCVNVLIVRGFQFLDGEGFTYLVTKEK